MIESHVSELITGIIGVIIGWVSKHMSDWFGSN